MIQSTLLPNLDYINNSNIIGLAKQCFKKSSCSIRNDRERKEKTKLMETAAVKSIGSFMPNVGPTSMPVPIQQDKKEISLKNIAS